MRKKGIGQEDQMHIQFGLLLRQYEGYGKMPNVISFTYLPMGELRSLATAAMLKKKGVRSGWPDYQFFVFRKANLPVEVVFLEFKTATGKQQESQRDFQLAFDGASNISYYLVRSIQEAVKVLEEEGILITS